MNCKRKLFILTDWVSTGIILLLLSVNTLAYAQSTNISGIINTVSARIDAVYFANSTDPDSVHVDNVSGFSLQDTVLIHMTVGATFYTSLSNEGTIKAFNNSGRYAIYKIAGIDVGNKIIILNNILSPFENLDPGEFGQIIKVPTYKEARIAGTLSCNPYNPVTGTGGILVFMVKQNLVFDADINVDGKGFPGATVEGDYMGTCSSTDPVKYSKAYFPSAESNYSALKGTGVVFTTNDTTRGRGAIANGGGGGNGKFSGGGGGSNAGAGGKGGFESASCGISNDIGGKGGTALSTPFYTDNRISLGGGGGTSSQDLSALPARIASPGGAGGGIVIIVCDTLKGNAKRISAKGQSVAGLATAGAGGGGGGGTIILHVNKNIGGDSLQVNGGNGGSIALTAPEATGPGGGGGGGMIWYNGVTLGEAVPRLTGGANGTYINANGALAGSPGVPKANLLIPIRGFLFNHVPDPDTICKHQTPKKINAADAVGGKGKAFFTYNWLQRIDGSSVWTDAAGIRNQAAYTPPDTTTVTMSYRRYVSDGLVSDTSNIVKMYVMPNISSNVFNPISQDTLCSGLNGEILTASAPGGGNGVYTYYWQLNNTNVASGGNMMTNFNPGILTASSKTTLNYRRIVRSGPPNTCADTSVTRRIIVLPSLSNNKISSSQEICTTRIPSEFTGLMPTGGNGTSYSYQWQLMNTASFINTGSNTPVYQSPALSTTHKFRRIVNSGLNNTCESISDTVTVTVMNNISNNSIDPIIQNELCSGLAAEILTATTPSGGNGSFSYYWQKNTINAAGGNVLTDFNPGILTDTVIFRRVVTSGTNSDSLQRCHSISNERFINVLDTIINNVLSVPQNPGTWCQGDLTPDDITGLIPQKGDGSYIYSWQQKLPSGLWTNRAETGQSFNTPVITSSVDYRRIVFSGLNATCTSASNVVSIIMQDSIRNNAINNNFTVFVCFDDDTTIQATIPGVLTGGDESVYTYAWLQSNTIDGEYSQASQAGNTNALYLTEPVQTTRYYKRSVVSGECENTSLPVKAETIPLPELTALSVDLDEICYNKLYSLIHLSAQSGTLPYSVTFSDGLGFSENRILTEATGSIEPLVGNPPLSPGYVDYNFRIESLTDAKGCRAKGDNLSPFSAALRLYTTPMPSRIGDELVESCSPTLKITVTPSIGASSWHLRNIIGITADNTINPEINLTASFDPLNDLASVSLAYVEDIANCPSDTIYVNAILYNNPDTVKNIYRVVNNDDFLVGDSVIIFISDNQLFRADNIDYGIPGWSLESGAGELSDLISLTTTISNLEQDDPAFLKYSISNGVCPPNSRTIKIVRKELLVYDGFSPNGDGINDELWSVGLADEEVSFKFQIFSSSGNFIREITRKDIKVTDLPNNQVVLWDGTTNLGGEGNYIPEGTYYYVLVVDYHGESFNKRGYIIVKP